MHIKAYIADKLLRFGSVKCFKINQNGIKIKCLIDSRKWNFSDLLNWIRRIRWSYQNFKISNFSQSFRYTYFMCIFWHFCTLINFLTFLYSGKILSQRLWPKIVIWTFWSEETIKRIKDTSFHWERSGCKTYQTNLLVEMSSNTGHFTRSQSRLSRKWLRQVRGKITFLTEWIIT